MVEPSKKKVMQTVYCCDSCGAEVSQSKPDDCPVCGIHHPTWEEYEREKPDSIDNEYTKKYEAVIEKLGEYTEGTEPEDQRYAFED